MALSHHTEILNASCIEQRPPTIWKMAEVTPLPKEKTVVDIKKEIETDIPDPAPLRKKEAKKFVVDGVVKTAVMSVLDESQYGAIPNSSTTMAVISMLHSWSLQL